MFLLIGNSPRCVPADLHYTFANPRWGRRIDVVPPAGTRQYLHAFITTSACGTNQPIRFTYGAVITVIGAVITIKGWNIGTDTPGCIYTWRCTGHVLLLPVYDGKQLCIGAEILSCSYAVKKLTAYVVLVCNSSTPSILDC